MERAEAAAGETRRGQKPDGQIQSRRGVLHGYRKIKPAVT